MIELETELKRLIIDTLMLEDVTPAQIDSEAPLFVEGLGLDSIDALELALAVSRKYAVRIKSWPRPSRSIPAGSPRRRLCLSTWTWTASTPSTWW